VGAIAKKELLKVPFFKLGFPLGHVVPIDRSNPAKAIESMKQGAQEMRRGHSLMAFPEGTRSTDGAVHRFKKGTFLMALEAGVPIVPIAIKDTRLVMMKGAGYCFPGDVYLQVLPPIETAGYTAEKVMVLIEKVRNMIVPLITTNTERENAKHAK
jgi:1-acyl-sn-glycerol-3-phosphate acyltransferase